MFNYTLLTQYLTKILEFFHMQVALQPKGSHLQEVFRISFCLVMHNPVSPLILHLHVSEKPEKKKIIKQNAYNAKTLP